MRLVAWSRWVVARVLLACVGVMCALPAQVALAHGRPLGVNQLFRVGGRNVLFTTRGAVLEGADGVYRWSCSRAYGDTGQALIPNLGLTASGTLVVGTIAGLYRRAPGACLWTRAPGALEFMFVGDVYALPVAGASVFAVTADPVPDNLVARSDDDGVSFAVVSVGNVRLQSVRVAPSDPQRVYAAGFTPGETPLATPAGVLLASVDGGQSFAPLSVPLETGELTVVVTHVPSADASAVWLRTVTARLSESPPERLLRVDAMTGDVTELLERRQLRGATEASGDDGAAWVISAPEGDQGGLLRVASDGQVSIEDASLDATCVLEEGGVLYACPLPRTGQTSALIQSTDGGRSFVRVLGFEEVVTEDGCSASDPVDANTCAADFGDLVRDSGALVTEPPPVRSMAGCAAMGGAPQLRWLELAGLGALLLAMRGRRPCGGWPRRRAAQTCGHLCRKRSMLGRCGGSLE
ncbi:MAG: hypothetical protein KC593_13735 [Myxococcales bacterium]|nr:hypothetical protein [Myxococcales bacterium]